MAKKTKRKQHPEETDTNESLGYLDGLHHEFYEHLQKYLGIIREQMALQARVELAEEVLRVTRDHFALAIKRTEGTLPRDWESTLAQVRFVGVRLSDACIELMREHKRLSPENLLCYLNYGQYRFRTNAPLREIHGALLRQPSVQRDGSDYVWAGEQATLLPRMHMVEAPPEVPKLDVPKLEKVKVS